MPQMKRQCSNTLQSHFYTVSKSRCVSAGTGNQDINRFHNLLAVMHCRKSRLQNAYRPMCFV